MPILTLKEQPAVPLEAESLSPDVTAGLALDAVRALPVYLGKTRRRVDDLFDVEGEAGDELEGLKAGDDVIVHTPGWAAA